ncbi:MAG: hypothetical protein QW727_01380 [Candidatus Pacearchaeota archaeon]
MKKRRISNINIVLGVVILLVVVFVAGSVFYINYSDDVGLSPKIDPCSLSCIGMQCGYTNQYGLYCECPPGCSPGQ